MDLTLFDLIASLIADILTISENERNDSVSKDYSDNLEQQAQELLHERINIKRISFNQKCVTSQDAEHIISACKERNNYLFYRSVLCLLDTMINIDILIRQYNFNSLNKDNQDRVFAQLNTNHDSTGIIIIPKVPVAKQTFLAEDDSGAEDKEFKNAHYWYDNLNEHFHNVIYVQKQKLCGWEVENVVIDFPKAREKDTIVIGLTPGSREELSKILKINETTEPTGALQSFEVEQYHDPTDLTKKYLDALETARTSKVDVLMGVEMLGTPELCDVDEFGFNERLQSTTGEPPHLIVTPSLWVGGKNYISVYLKSGELVGRQYKQNGFEYSHKGEKFLEKLQDIPKKILLIHVPGWGRLAFPICVDYLVAQYREVLARELKLDFMLCPSYSSGTLQFTNASGAIREYGTRLVWLNSCSALRKHFAIPQSVGLVSTPVRGTGTQNDSINYICPKCKGECVSGCLFTATISLRSHDDRHCNDVEIKHIPFEEV